MPAPVYRFPCGCEFPILQERVGEFPLLDFSFDNVRRDCPAVYELLSTGATVGIFQIEQPLGQQWSRRLKPETMQHIAALGAILRPGTLNSATADGVSMTEHYCRRKNKEEEPDRISDSLTPYLGDTYYIIIYQETFMKIAEHIAGFDLVAVDKLRKGVGKKDYTIINDLKEKFISGCVKVNLITIEQAELIWSWIEAAGRYSFNKSHAVEYGLITYWSAFAKVHNPLYFSAAWLSGTRFKGGKAQEGIAILVEDATRFNVSVLGPRLTSPSCYFDVDSGAVRFGLAGIKGMGEKTVDKFKKLSKYAQQFLKKSLPDFSWLELYIFVLSRLPKQVANNLIAAGACDDWGISRARMLTEHHLYCSLRAGEQEWLYKAMELQQEPACLEELEVNLQSLLSQRLALKKAGAENVLIRPFDLDIADCRLAINVLKASLPPFDSFEEALGFLALYKSDRPDEINGHISLLRNPASSDADSIRSIVKYEEELLGIAVTAHRLDQVDMSEANCSISEFLAGRTGQIFLGVEIVEVKQCVTKTGKNPGSAMAQVRLRDRTGSIRAVCFPNDYERCAGLLTDGAMVLVHGEASKKDKSQLVIKSVWRPGKV